ncbi:MAG: LysR family transcriptional regulator [Marinobacterium sp.]|nr:LysR family transcriptional regulator [Marinobacterium sp.]
MDLSQAEIRAFNATVETGNFTRAGQLLGISQPAITSQIRKLEGRFSQPLFDRVSRGVRLTAVGERLHRITRQYADLDQLVGELASPDGQGEARVIRVATASPLVFMPLLAAFKTAYPDVSLRIISGTTDECRRLLQDRDVDIGLFPMSRRTAELASLPYATHHLTVVVPAAHPLANEEILSVIQLMDYPLIFSRLDSYTQQRVERAFAGKQLRPVSHVFMDSRHDTCEAVVHGLGIGFALENDIRPDPRYRAIPLLETPEPVQEHLVWLKVRGEFSCIRDFVNLALEHTCSAGAGTTMVPDHNAMHYDGAG